MRIGIIRANTSSLSGLESGPTVTLLFGQVAGLEEMCSRSLDGWSQRRQNLLKMAHSFLELRYKNCVYKEIKLENY